MDNKKKATSKNRRLLSRKQLILLSITLISIIVAGSILSFVLLQATKFSMKAVIYDQLGQDFPNPQFVDNVTSMLSAAGFTVTYYESQSVNVTLLSRLAKDDYGIIILRNHSALRIDNSTVDLFTSEEFTLDKYAEKVNDGQLSNGSYLWNRDKHYFAVTYNFIDNLEGAFPRSVVVAMGCWSLKPGAEQLANAFINKGAEVYIGWTDMVEPSHTDSETIKLLRMLLEGNQTIEDAVYSTEPDYSFPPARSTMGFYRQTSAVGNLRISDLIAEARNTTASKLQLMILDFYSDSMPNRINSRPQDFGRLLQSSLVMRFSCVEASAATHY
jgi:hypothetical protein